ALAVGRRRSRVDDAAEGAGPGAGPGGGAGRPRGPGRHRPRQLGVPGGRGPVDRAHGRAGPPHILAAMTSVRPAVSVVIPIFNEADNLEDLHRELTAALEGMGRPYEIILVDDGSTDGSLARMADLESRDRRLRVLALRRNF